MQGWCVAGGTDMILNADLIVAGEAARFGYPPARVWGVPEAPWVWVARLGLERAKRYLFTGDELTGREAADAGMILECVARRRPRRRTRHALAQRIALLPLNQLQMMKWMLNDVARHQYQPDTSRLLGFLFDGVARHTQEGLDFVDRAQEIGWRDAVRERDAPFGDYGERPRPELICVARQRSQSGNTRRNRALRTVRRGMTTTGHSTDVDHVLAATPDTCYWGYIDRDQPPVLEVDTGARDRGRGGHAPRRRRARPADGRRHPRDLGRDRRGRPAGPGVHILTGPIAVRGAEPGDSLAVEILGMTPRLPYGSNCAAHWGLLYEHVRQGADHDLRARRPGAGAVDAQFPATATPLFGFDFRARGLYDVPGVISEPDPRRSASRSAARVHVPVRPHFGVMGVAPATPGRLSSIPPGVFGGNVDNWRVGPGATMRYPVFVDGANLYVGDPHFAQGDGEICGTAIEASLDRDDPGARSTGRCGSRRRCSRPTRTGTRTASAPTSTRR